MANCENCIHKYVCKNYPVDSLPPIVRQSIFKKLDEECKEYINNADANLVVHGKWLTRKDYEDNYQTYACSICDNSCVTSHNEDDTVTLYRTKYCPNCGAKMDKEVY